MRLTKVRSVLPLEQLLVGSIAVSGTSDLRKVNAQPASQPEERAIPPDGKFQA